MEVSLTLTILQNIQLAVHAGVDWVQLREKDLPVGQLLELARATIHLSKEQAAGTDHQPQTIINDRLDVALAARADGVHLGRESAPVRDVVRWCRAGNAPNGFVRLAKRKPPMLTTSSSARSLRHRRSRRLACRKAQKGSPKFAGLYSCP